MILKKLEFDECVIRFSDRTGSLNSDAIINPSTSMTIEQIILGNFSVPNSLLSVLPYDFSDWDVPESERRFYVKNRNWVKINTEGFLYGELMYVTPASEAGELLDDKGITLLNFEGTHYIAYPTFFCIYIPKGKSYGIAAFEKVKVKRSSPLTLFSGFLFRNSRQLGFQCEMHIEDKDLLRTLAKFKARKVTFVQQEKTKRGLFKQSEITVKSNKTQMEKTLEKVPAKNVYEEIIKHKAYVNYDDTSIDYVKIDLETDASTTKRTLRIDSNGNPSLNNYDTIEYHQKQANSRCEEDYKAMYDKVKVSLNKGIDLIGEDL